MEKEITSNKRKQLEGIVGEARQLLDQSVEKRESRAYQVLLNMTEKAEEALAGKRFPFTCQREFWKKHEDDEISFYLDHMTKSPSFCEEPGKDSN